MVVRVEIQFLDIGVKVLLNNSKFGQRYDGTTAACQANNKNQMEWI